MSIQNGLSRRERQILDILFKRGRATAAEVHADLPDRPSNSAVRAHLRTLEEKGHVKHEAKDLRYVYSPAVQPAKARKWALGHLVETFFEGSPANAAAALLDANAASLTDDDLNRLSALIDKARKEGR